MQLDRIHFTVWLWNVVVLVQVLKDALAFANPNALHRPYHLPEQEHILSTNKEDATLDISIAILHECPLYCILKHKVR